MTNPMSDDIRRILEEAQARKRMQRDRDCSELNVDGVNDPEDTIDEPLSSEHNAESGQDAMAMTIRPDQTLLFPRIPDADVDAHLKTEQLHQTNNSYHFNPVHNYNINCTDVDTLKRLTIGGNKPDDPSQGWLFFRSLGSLYSWLPLLARLAFVILVVSCLVQVALFLKYPVSFFFPMYSSLLAMFRRAPATSSAPEMPVVTVPSAIPVIIPIAPFMYESAGVNEATVDLCGAVAAMHASTEPWTALEHMNMDLPALSVVTAEDMQGRIRRLIPQLDDIYTRLTAILSEQADVQARLINTYQESLVSRPVSWEESVCRWVHYLGLCTPEPTPRERMHARWKTLHQALKGTIAKLQKIHKSLSSVDDTLGAEGTSLQLDISKVANGMKETHEEAIKVIEQVHRTLGNAEAKEMSPISAYSDLLRKVFERVDYRKKRLTWDLKNYIQALKSIANRAESQVGKLEQPGRDVTWELDQARKQMGEDLAKWVKLGEMLSSKYIKE
ncbi:hypothetical protein QQZ08_004608 [Neonectria magnoliae]|uniref:Uncharacterized protein n=1 Tax=Neonectria magnoliae TaxID=2732573 RepID=A0ABR1I7K2_9HYPO